VHPEWLRAQRLAPDTRIDDHFWERRYESINAFERHLDRSGTKVLKFFLHISREEQKKRFLARLDDPDKQWKFSTADLAERAFWNDYQAAYEAALTATSTHWAPWYVIPADHKYVARTLVAAVMAQTVRGLKLEHPRPTAEQLAAIEKAREQLQAED
jgi:polyphosphate kinase 2 (PPK2 family)